MSKKSFMRVKSKRRSHIAFKIKTERMKNREGENGRDR